MVNVGRMIYGFCNGFFGRDDYSDKIIVFETECSICCRIVDRDIWRDNGWLTVANFDSEKEKQEYINEWSKK